MPNIALDVRTKDYTTDQGVAARSHRLFVNIQLGTIRPLCILDTGAPFNIVSYAVVQQIPWTRRGASMFFQGTSVSLDWQGIPCDFGEAAVSLLDPLNQGRTGPFRLVGKFARSRHPSLENYVLLGMNFLVDNGIDLSLESQAGPLTGVLVIP